MRPDIWGALVRTWRGAWDGAFDETVTYLSRGSGPDLLDLIRHQPSTALLAVMLRRFKIFDPNKLERRIERCEELRKLISLKTFLVFAFQLFGQATPTGCFQYAAMVIRMRCVSICSRLVLMPLQLRRN